MCVAAGSVAYLGPFTSDYRVAMAEGWRAQLSTLAVPHTEGASVSSVMADPVKVRIAWHSMAWHGMA